MLRRTVLAGTLVLGLAGAAGGCGGGGSSATSTPRQASTARCTNQAEGCQRPCPHDPHHTCTYWPDGTWGTVPAGGSGGTEPSSTTTSTAPSSPTVSPLLAGTAHPTLTAGTPGKVDVTYVGTPVDLGGSAGTSVPVIVWNGTKGTVTHLDVSGPATDSSGSVIGSGDSQDIEPQNLTPGQVAFGMVFFEQSVPTGSKFNFTVSYDQGPSTYFLDAQVTQANFENDQFGDGTITGSVVNNGTASMHGPISSDAFCFDGSGTITSVFPGFISGNGGLAPGQTGSYSISLFEDVDCSTYLVGASGFGSL